MLKTRRILTALRSHITVRHVGRRNFCAGAAQAQRQSQSEATEAPKEVIRYNRNWLKEPKPVEKDWHRANGFLEKAVAMLRPIIDEKKKEGVQIFYRKEDEGLFVHTDGDRVIQILTCFLDNALKYTSVPEGSANVFPTKIWIGCERLVLLGNRMRFYVKDTGSGVTKEFRDTLMEYEPNQTKPTPLQEGLKTAQTLAKDLGTTAYCISHHELTASRRIKRHMQRPDVRGATFLFEMDMEHECRKPEPKEGAEPLDTPIDTLQFSKRFLVAEGHNLSREALRRGLGHLGASSVVDVCTQDEILMKCAREEYDLVMIGHRLHGNTFGKDAVQELRKQGYKGKVFAMQSQAGEEWPDVDFMEKAPMGWERLEIALDTIFNGAPHREPTGLFGNKVEQAKE